LNSQPMGFYAPAQLVADAKRHGVEVRPIDVNFSEWDCTLEAVSSEQLAVSSKDNRPRGSSLLTAHCSLLTALRLGFRLIHGMAQKHIDAVVRARRDGPFRTFAEFVARTGLAAVEARTLLAKFGLGADHVLRPCSSLSPGERTRAHLAELQARRVNVLILDEPTNHLDLEAVEQLERALVDFDGALVVVSHDRRFLERIAPTRSVTLPL